MIQAEDVRHDIPQTIQDSHDLQLRLYREIGILAVAAALNVSAERAAPRVEPYLADLPSLLRGDEVAA